MILHFKMLLRVWPVSSLKFQYANRVDATVERTCMSSSVQLFVCFG